LDHFEQLTSRELTFRDLAKKVGMSKSALQEAFAKEVEAIRGMLEDAA
jgi:transcriptional regulator GlxA family with amidase domain